MRINARLDTICTQQLDYIALTTQSTVTEVVRQAIAHYYRKIVKSKRPDAAAIFEETGFLGAARGDTHLSTDYKRHLTAALNKKYDHR